MATSYRRKIVDLQYKIANEVEKAQELIRELKQLVKENQNLDLVNLRKLREAKEIQKRAKDTSFSKRCSTFVNRTCHKQKQPTYLCSTLRKLDFSSYNSNYWLQ